MEQTKELYDISKIENIERKTEKSVFRLYWVVVRAVGFLLARAVPIAGFAPFGISFLAMERRFSKRALVSAGMVLLGYLSLFELPIALKYICATFAYILFLFVSGGERDVPLSVAISVTGIITALCRMGEMIWIGFSLGGIIHLICDTAMVAIGGFVLERSRRIFIGKRGILFAMNSEERVCVGILAAIALVGFKTVRFSDFLSVANIIGLWAVAVFSLCGGTANATLCGVIVGALLGMGGDLAVTTAVYAVCGVAGGVASKYGKTAVCVSVTAIAAVTALYCIGNGIIPFGYIDIPIASLLVILTSDRTIRLVGRVMGVGEEDTGEERCKEFVRSRLNSAAESFRILAETFLDLSDTHRDIDLEDVSRMFDGTAERVCRECPKMADCWVTGFNSTYKSMFHMFKAMERKGELTERDADEIFSGRCLRMRSVVREMNRLFEIYKINCVWKSKLAENRELAGQQLGSVALILDNIAQEVYEEKLDDGVEEEIRMRMAAKGTEIAELNVTVNAKGRYTAFMRVIDGKENCRRTAEIVLHTVLGVKMVEVGTMKSSERGVTMRFAQPEGYRIEGGISSIGKLEESGDNCVMRYLSDGKYAVALSDGMGTGHMASRDSGATVRLLGDFLEAGFDKTVAVRLVNSIMVMKSADEAFATVDMCVIDLYSGETEFVKNGAEPSYIKRRDNTETIRSASLPVGVMQDMEIETFAHKVGDGDTIVMLSDGLQMKKGHEEWIKRMVEEADFNMPPQELADRIMDMASALCDGKAEDDMTVVVLKVSGIN